MTLKTGSTSKTFVFLDLLLAQNFEAVLAVIKKLPGGAIISTALPRCMTTHSKTLTNTRVTVLVWGLGLGAGENWDWGLGAWELQHNIQYMR